MSLPELEALAYFLEVSPVSLWDNTYIAPDDSSDEELPLEQMMILRRKMLAVQLRKCRETSGFTQEEMAERLGCSTYMLSQYEQGNSDIPLAELGLAAETCGRSLSDFVDDQTIPLGKAERERQTLARLDELSPDLQAFVLNPTNRPYLHIARRMSALEVDNLRQLAETLLELTAQG